MSQHVHQHHIAVEEYRHILQEQQKILSRKENYDLNEVNDLPATSPQEQQMQREQQKQQEDSALNKKIQWTPFPQVNMVKFVLVLVGLPARGKSYLSYMLSKYLNWLNISTQVFNVGQYRRDLLGAGQSANFWNHGDQQSYQLRQQMSVRAMDDLIDFLKNREGQVAIFDATNTTRQRRDYIIDRVSVPEHEGGLGLSLKQVIFIESICTDDSLIESNVSDIKVKSKDYENADPDAAVHDFFERIRQYEKIYQPLDENSYDKDKTFIKLINVRQRIVMNRISGYLPSKITTLLMNTHIIPRKVFLTRHGESEYNVYGKLGGDSGLSSLGQCYEEILPQFLAYLDRKGMLQDPADYEALRQQYPSSPCGLVVWTSMLNRTIQTASKLPYPTVHVKALDEIDAGICDGMTYEQIEQNMPEDWERRQKDKYNYKYPRGESYHDVVNRLEPVILEMERQRTPLLIVSHNAITRVLYSYLTNKSPDACTRIPIPLHTVIEIRPTAYGCHEIRHNLEPLVNKLHESKQKQQQRQQQQEN